MDRRECQLRTTDGMLAVIDELAAETGEDRDEWEADLREMRATFDTVIARRLIVAERK